MREYAPRSRETGPPCMASAEKNGASGGHRTRLQQEPSVRKSLAPHDRKRIRRRVQPAKRNRSDRGPTLPWERRRRSRRKDDRHHRDPPGRLIWRKSRLPHLRRRT